MRGWGDVFYLAKKSQVRRVGSDYQHQREGNCPLLWGRSSASTPIYEISAYRGHLLRRGTTNVSGADCIIFSNVGTSEKNVLRRTVVWGDVLVVLCADVCEKSWGGTGEAHVCCTAMVFPFAPSAIESCEKTCTSKYRFGEARACRRGGRSCLGCVGIGKFCRKLFLCSRGVVIRYYFSSKP